MHLATARIDSPARFCLRALLIFAAVIVCTGQRRARATEPIPISGRADPALAPLDELMTRFLREQGIPGAALAVAKDGRLLYSRGFGWADRKQRRVVQPRDRFRIASLSKPITAAAVLQLARSKQLRLDDPVVRYLDDAYAPAQPQAVDARWQKITIRHLLRHRGGWDRDQSYDPMFRPIEIAQALGTRPPAGPREIIRFMRSQPLDFDPGTRYAYSNFGYCLLGRVIEHCSGLGYETYVQRAILRPLGIGDMRIGATLLKGRQPDEVLYYTKNDALGRNVFAVESKERVPQPYGCWHLEAMDAHGGWIASAPSLVKFAAAFPSRRIVTDQEWKLLTARPAGEKGATYYGLGFFVRPVREGAKRAYNVWHTGSLPGTAALLVVRHDGFCWAVLMNSRDTPSGQHPARLIDPLIHQAVDKVAHWPGGTPLYDKP